MKPTTKIAPTLTEWLAPKRDGEEESVRVVEMRREFRALRRVARAAAAVHRVDGGGSNTDIPLEYWRPLQALNRAVDSLRRASGAPSRQRRGR